MNIYWGLKKSFEMLVLRMTQHYLEIISSINSNMFYLSCLNFLFFLNPIQANESWRKALIKFKSQQQVSI